MTDLSSGGKHSAQMELQGHSPVAKVTRTKRLVHSMETDGDVVLPDPREVNKQISEEMRQERMATRRKAKNVGTAAGLVQKIQKRHPGNPKRQFALFLQEYAIYAGTGRRRQISEKTRTEYYSLLIKAVDQLREQRAPIQNIGELGKTHALVLIRLWTDQNLNPAVVQNKISKLRCYLTWIGKDTAIPTHGKMKQWLADNGIERDFWTKTVADKSKAWAENGVDFQAVVEKAREVCGWTAMQLELQDAFGLRMAESININPQAADLGDVLRVIDGTKGGRPRDFAFFEDMELRARQRDVLERAKLWAKKNRRGVLAPDGLTIKQAKDHFYYVLKRLGITRKNLGVTSHGLRHGFAALTYEQVTGFAPPISRNAPLEVTLTTKELDRVAREQVTKAMGHFRIDVPKAYVGSLPGMERSRRIRIDTWLAKTDGSLAFQNIMRTGGVVQCWLGGSAAEGVEFAPREKLRVLVRFAKAGMSDGRVIAHLRGELEKTYSMSVDLGEWVEAGSPPDALEVFVRRAKEPA